LLNSTNPGQCNCGIAFACAIFQLLIRIDSIRRLYAREKAFMKDMPAALLVALAAGLESSGSFILSIVLRPTAGTIAQ
jgi:hypothetical protein